jgi:hypothetical protein
MIGIVPCLWLCIVFLFLFCGGKNIAGVVFAGVFSIPRDYMLFSKECLPSGACRGGADRV